MELHLDATPEELALFAAETDELLQSLDELLVGLEQRGAVAEDVQAIFRAAHTIKGSAAMVGHVRLAECAHAMESLLDLVRRGTVAVSAALVDQLLAGLDTLKALAGELQGEPCTLDVAAVVAALDACAANSSAEAAAAEATTEVLADPPADTPPGATHRVVVAPDEGGWPAVRAMQALLTLERCGTVLECDPSRDNLQAGAVPERLSAWVSTEVTTAELSAMLGDIDELQVLQVVEVDEIVAVTAEVSAPAPPPAPAATIEDREAAPARAVAPAEAPFAPQSPVAGEPLAAAAKPGETQTAPAKRGGSATVRIDVERLDNLMNLVGELVTQRTRLQSLCRRWRERLDQFEAYDDLDEIGAADGEFEIFMGDCTTWLADLGETALHLDRIGDGLQAEVMKSRMLPVGTVFSRFPRVVRDLSHRQGKQVELVIEGAEAELDRSVIEEIGDPLVHLVRNAIDHGIEVPETRSAAGKPPTATVRLTASHVEQSIVIAVEDDGRGIDPARVRARAVERGLLTEEAAARLPDREAVDLVFAPGFSTAETVTDVSGRGVGMDIVRTNIERLGGSVEVETEVGQGTRFLLRLPLTLAVVQALLVKAGTNTYAIPVTSVLETAHVDAADIRQAQNEPVVVRHDRVLPLASLAELLGDERPGAHDSVRIMVAVRAGERQLGLEVDALLGTQDVVIKALGSLMGDVPGVSSAAIMGDGTVALIVDVSGLVGRALNGRRARRAAAADARLEAIA